MSATPDRSLSGNLFSWAVAFSPYLRICKTIIIIITTTRFGGISAAGRGGELEVIYYII